MKVYTTYFANLRKLPEDIIPINISVIEPKWYTGLSYKKLAPTTRMLYDWKCSHNQVSYTREYKRNILCYLNASQVLSDLLNLAGSDKIALVCYEKPESFCHRHLVREWLNLHGIPCDEYNYKRVV